MKKVAGVRRHDDTVKLMAASERAANPTPHSTLQTDTKLNK